MDWVLFFDGDCVFCSRSVQRVAHFDTLGKISFAPLQGKLSHEKGFTGYASNEGGTMVLLRESDGKVFTHSDALIQLTRIFGGWWRIFSWARLIPKPLRDAAYRWIARNRYRIMGRNVACVIPDPAMQKRIRD